MSNFLKSKLAVPAATLVTALSLVACGTTKGKEPVIKTVKNPKANILTAGLVSDFWDTFDKLPDEGCRFKMREEHYVPKPYKGLFLQDGSGRIIKLMETEDIDGTDYPVVGLFGPDEQTPIARLTPFGATVHYGEPNELYIEYDHLTGEVKDMNRDDADKAVDEASHIIEDALEVCN